MADEEDAAASASSAPDNGNPLLVAAPPVEESVDRQIRTLLRETEYTYFDQWRRNYRRGAPFRLRAALSELLPTLLAARDYAGAAKVLSVMYQRFAVTPALCIEASLEILRRQPDYRNDLLSFYEAALNERRLDKMLLLKELLLFHIIHGEFYEAYHLFQDKIQNREESEKDARLLSNFGMLCYWLLFIESKEMREVLKRENLEDDEDEDVEDAEGDDFDGRFQSNEGIESVIESTYLFKTPIGVHILYQHASGALRRAVALCPDSAIFVEYYAQLLVLVGDIQSACDFLESFFHAYPADPHGARMLSGFLDRYYPDSVDSQVAVYIRWIKADPSCRYALEKVMELSSAGAISSYTLTKALVEALDTCGSDMYIIQNPQVALTLWRNLAELLTAMDDEEFSLAQVEGHKETIAEIGAQHLWWKRVYFFRPSTVDEAVAVSHRSAALFEASIYRAAVANRFYPECLAMPAALCSAMTSSNPTINRDHLRLFKSFFPTPVSPTEARATPRAFHDKPFINVIVCDEAKDVTLPVFKGFSTVHVIDRKSIIKTVPAGDKAKIEVTREGEDKDLDPQLVEELFEALDGEVRSQNSSGEPPQQNYRAADASDTPTPAIIPAYVAMVEEEAYCYPDATPRHIFTMVSEKLALSDMVVPTFKQVLRLIRYFRLRWAGNLSEYGHRGMLLRYEAFLAKYVLNQRKQDMYEVTKEVVKAAIQDMKRVLPSSHPHFPDENLVELVMCNKMSSFARQRRVRLTEVRKALRPILKQFLCVNENALTAAAWSVCKEGGLEGVVTREDIWRLVQSLLPGHYFWIIEAIDVRSQRLLSSPEIRGTSNNPATILSNVRRRTKHTKVTIPQIQAVIWMERYEAVHGRLVEDDSEFWQKRGYRFLTRKRARKSEEKADEEARKGRTKRKKVNRQSDSEDGGVMVEDEVYEDEGETKEGETPGERRRRNSQNNREDDIAIVDVDEQEKQQATDDTSEDDDDGDSEFSVDDS